VVTEPDTGAGARPWLSLVQDERQQPQYITM
jgi:hypothetical protein